MTAETALSVEVDPVDLDLDLVHRWLSNDAYWALGRTLDEVTRAAAPSVNLVARLDGVTVGYARIVTDRVLFAWLCDVYVDRAARGHRAGVALVDRAVALVDGWGVARTALRTGDAHGLYERAGFATDPPGQWMTRWRP